VEPLDLLTGLAKIYSPSNQEAEAVAYLVEAMEALGFMAWADAVGNAIGVMGDGPTDIVLLGHIDTVAGFIPVRLEGGQLYGRGTVDAKGPLAAFVSAVARVGPQPGRRLIVIGAVAEEGDSHGAQYVAQHYGPGAAPDDAGTSALNLSGQKPYLIIGEPSGWQRVTLGYKGSMWLEYRVQAEVAHSAGRAESASELAVAFWNRVTAYAAEQNVARGAERVFDQLTPTLRGMNSTSDGFTDEATLRLGLRLPPGLAVADVRAALGGLAGGGAAKILDGAVPAFRGEKNTPLVRAFLSAIRQANGNPTFGLKTGTSDMNIAAPGWGSQAVAYGPGDSSLDHTPDEHVDVAEYLRTVDVLAAVLSSLPIAP
jgi:[amino group carrier protein]-lysine/ornithine hydrolase